MALSEIDRAIAAGVRFGCVLADAGYGLSAPFRQGLTARKLAWAVGIPRHLKVYPAVLQAFHLLALQPTELLAPPIIRHLAHADLADCVHHILALRDQNIDLPQLRNDLFRLVSLPP
jgi:hypothetical protein